MRDISSVEQALANLSVRRNKNLFITITNTHPAAGQLANLAQLLRALKRKELGNAPASLEPAVNIAETNHGNRTTTYSLKPGRASSSEAIATYQYIRRYYPSILDLLCYAASKDAKEITIEVGVASRSNDLTYSQHDLIKIMPRILALFRGTVGIE